jgi:hypothetical protein
MKFYRLLYNICGDSTQRFYLMIVFPDKTLYQVPSPWSYLTNGTYLFCLLVSLANRCTFVGCY